MLKSILVLTVFFALTQNARAAVDSDLRGLLGPVRNQGVKRNVCSAFEATALAEFLVKEKTGQQFAFSENYNYFAAKTYQLTTPELQAYLQVDGMAGSIAVQALANGVVLASDWPYENTNGISRGDSECSQTPIPLRCFVGVLPPAARVIPLKVKIETIDGDKIADFLAEKKRPVVMNIYFYFAAADSRGNLRMPTAAEKKACEAGDTNVCGGHVILLVGYNSTTDRFIFRNSWGPSWGQSGYGTIPAKYVTEDCELCQYVKSVDQYPESERASILSATKGTSAELLESPVL